MKIRTSRDAGRDHPDVLGYKCFRCDLAIRRYPFIEWQGAIEGKEFGAIFLHPKCATKLGGELIKEGREAMNMPSGSRRVRERRNG